MEGFANFFLQNNLVKKQIILFWHSWIKKYTLWWFLIHAWAASDSAKKIQNKFGYWQEYPRSKVAIIQLKNQIGYFDCITDAKQK